MKRHNNLRRSHEAMDTLSVTNQTSKLNRKQVIYSSGVVSRGLVEDRALYPAHTRADRVEEYNGTMDVVPHTTRRMYTTARPHRTEESEFADARAYHWPASHAFDYNVQSYSKVIMTQGQALLDPSLSLHKNPFAWAREMYGAKYAGSTEHTTFTGEDAEKESSFEPTITEADEGMDVDHSNGHENHSSPVVKPIPVVTTMPMDISTTPSDANAVVPVYTSTNTLDTTTTTTIAKAALPALPYLAHGQTENEVNGLHKLLSDSNFMTLKLPASSIRVGKSWSASKEGTVESLMDVFNISRNNEDKEGQMYGGEASVEINCIILGAKLVVSQTPQA